MRAAFAEQNRPTSTRTWVWESASGSGDAGARQAGHGPTQWAQSGFQEGVDAVGDHLSSRDAKEAS